MQTAQRHAHVLALQRVGNAFAQRGLTDSRRTVEAEDGRLQVAAQREHGYVLQDALLHLLHAVVVTVQYFLCPRQVHVVLGVFAPRQVYQGLQVSQLHVEVGRVLAHLVELLHLLVEELLHLFRPFLLAGFLQQFLFLGRVLVAHLCLQVLDLLLQEVVALLLVNVVASLVADVQLQVLQADFAVYDAQHAEQSLLDAVKAQQGHFLLDGERHVRADEVQGHDVVAHVLNGKRGLFGYLVTHLDVLRRLLAQVLNGRAELHVALVGFVLRSHCHAANQVGLVFQQVQQAHTSQPLHDGRDVAVGQRQRLQHLGEYANVVQVGPDGRLYFGVALAHHTDHGTALLGLADE